MTLDSLGLLSGTPTAAGFGNVNFTISDSTGTVFSGVNFQISAVNITTPGVLPNATQNAAYNTTITASGGTGPYTFSASNFGGFGLTLNSAGVISGTSNSVGKFNFQVTARDTSGVSYTKSMSITIVGAPPVLPSISPYGNSSVDDLTIGVPSSRGFNVFSGGRAPFTWTASGLPPGMVVRFDGGATFPTTVSWISPGDAELWGRPTATGTYNVQLTVTDADSKTATNTFPVKVTTLLQTNTLQNGTLGTPYPASSGTMRVIGGTSSYTVAKTGGLMPAGLTPGAATLVASGTPAESGFFNPTFTFADSGSATLRFTNYFTINGAGSGSGNINDNYDLGSATTGPFYSTAV